MADYNIYIHAVNTGGNSNPTTPWSQRATGGAAAQTKSGAGGAGGVDGAGFAMGVIRAAAYAQNPDSAIASAFSSLARAFPIIAAAVAVVKLGESIADNVVEFNEIESGDYSAGVAWSNFKNGARTVLHPISSAVQNFKIQNQWKRENKKLQAQRDLLGDSVINSYTRRGV